MKKKVEDKDLNKVNGGGYYRYNYLKAYKCNDCGHTWRSTGSSCCPECESTNIKEETIQL